MGPTIESGWRKDNEAAELVEFEAEALDDAERVAAASVASRTHSCARPIRSALRGGNWWNTRLPAAMHRKRRWAPDRAALAEVALIGVAGLMQEAGP